MKGGLVKMRYFYESTPLPECKNCSYRGTRLNDEMIRGSTPRVLCPISMERSCNQDYCLIDRPASKKEDK